MIKREEDGLWIQIEESIAAHHEVVFASLTTPGGLSRWFPVAAKVDVAGVSSRVLSIDNRPDASYDDRQ